VVLLAAEAEGIKPAKDIAAEEIGESNLAWGNQVALIGHMGNLG
jgi:hypothetical protein